jgi:hypothetical protein
MTEDQMKNLETQLCGLRNINPTQINGSDPIDSGMKTLNPLGELND